MRGRLAPGCGIGEAAVQSALCRRDGADQIDLSVSRAAAAFKVAVEGTHGHAAGHGRAAHADAGTAGALQKSHAAVEQRGKRTLFREHGQHLTGTGRHAGVGFGTDAAAAQGFSHEMQIGVGRVGAGAHGHLIHAQTVKLGNGNHVVGHVGTGYQRHDGGKIHFHLFVVLRIFVRSERLPVLLTPHLLQEFAGTLVGGEERARGAEFRAHVGDGGAFRHGKRAHAGTAVFKDAPHAALDAQTGQHVQNDVLGLRPSGQTTGEPHLDDLGHGNAVGFPGHGKGHGKTAGAHGETAHAAGVGGMAVGSEKHAAGPGEVFQMKLMTDAGAGSGVHRAEALRRRAQEAMVVGIAEPHLQRIVIHIAYRKLGTNGREAQGFKLKPGHGARGVLRKRLIHTKPDFLSGDHLPFHQVGTDNLVSNVHGKTFHGRQGRPVMRGLLTIGRNKSADSAPEKLGNRSRTHVGRLHLYKDNARRARVDVEELRARKGFSLPPRVRKSGTRHGCRAEGMGVYCLRFFSHPEFPWQRISASSQAADSFPALWHSRPEPQVSA